MNNKEKYEKWEPIESLPNRMHCEAIHDDYEGIRLLLKGDDKHAPILRVMFESILAYRNIDESCFLRTFERIKDREIFPLYKVRNSVFLAWLNEESYGSYEDQNIVHYAFFCQDEIIDILSQFEPTVEWLNI